jgi:hypothetical protein
MHDVYTIDRADESECPFCCARAPAIAAGGHVQFVMLDLTCPECQRRWIENRTPGELRRFWDERPSQAAEEARLNR